jgi:hypothetical protein
VKIVCACLIILYDPHYKQPLVLASNLAKLTAESAYLICRDRWPVSPAPQAGRPPLATKQMIGLHRQFVFADESCFRLPELSLIASAILTYLAAVLPPIPSGFWDRSPASTPGRLRRLLPRHEKPTCPAVCCSAWFGLPLFGRDQPCLSR